MTAYELRATITQLREQLQRAPRGSITEVRIEQDLDHYGQRLANLEAGYGDTPVMRTRLGA